MKSLLVDALRAANDNDDDLRLEETIAPGLPTSSPEEHVAPPERDAELELLDKVEESADMAAANSDARFPHETAVADVPLRDTPIVLPPGRAAIFERSAKWMPVVCVLLVACSAAAFSGWNNITGMNQSAAIGAFPGQSNAQPEPGVLDADNGASRFPFIGSVRQPVASTRQMIVAATASRDGAATATSTMIVMPVAAAPRAVAGTMEVDDASFSSLAAVYEAHVSGQINRNTLDRLLERAVIPGDAATELELKMLLQRYPDSASLHNALGTVLANSARWPEARVAFERAGELAENRSGSLLQ